MDHYSMMVKESSERNRAEAALFELAAIVESSNDAIIGKTLEGVITSWNKSAERIYGYKAQEVIGRPISIIIPPELQGELPRIMKMIERGERVDYYETERVKKDGRRIRISLTVSPIKDQDGRIRGASAIARDITEGKRTEDALRESEERLQTVIENLTEGLVISDLDGNLLHWNRAGLEMHGFESLDEGRRHLPEFNNIFELAELDGTVLSLEQWPLARIFRGETLRDFEVLIRRLDKYWERIFSYSGSIVYEASGKPLAFVSVTDITERKRAEESLREQAKILDLAPVLIRDLNDRIIFWNSGAEQMYGWTKEEALGSNVHSLFQTEFPQPLEEIKASLYAHAHWEGELVHTRRDGATIMVASHWVLHKGKHGRPKAILEVNNDITELKRAENQIRRLNETLEHRVAERTEQLQAANKELEAFSYSVSHDLRAPLRHINGFSQALLEDYGDKLDTEGQSYLREVRAASQEMTQLIDDMLQLARVARSEMRREQVNLSHLAEEVIAELQKGEPTRAVSIQIEDGLETSGDKRLLKIMFANLLGNAWKFTSKQEQTEIAFGQQREASGEIIYYIRDNGAGFDMAYVNKLFGAFQRLHTANEFEGTGIGLATVQRIINRHGGRVWAEGQVNEGATFYFTLPDSQERGDGEESDLIG